MEARFARDRGLTCAVAELTGALEIVFREDIGWHSWSSPVVVGEELLVATCTGELRSYSITDPRQPVLQWAMQLSESCIESTPAVWDGRIYVGVRDGKFYEIGG